MLTPRQEIAAAVRTACETVLGTAGGSDFFVKPCQDVQFGDLQTNAAMIYAKAAGKPPRALAEALVAALPPSAAFSKPEIAGPGFINFRLLPEYCAAQVSARAPDPRVGLDPVTTPETVILDFSGPNVAKEMHVGHIRSTILGDALSRIYRFLGHLVITDNHLGDWGRQFGIILLGFKKYGDRVILEQNPTAHLEEIYQRVNEECKTDESLLAAARQELLKLQQGDPENLKLWKEFIDYTLVELDKIYARLGVKFDYTLGESFYNDRLEPVVKDLREKGIAVESQGAIAVFHDPSQPKKGSPFLTTDSTTGEIKDSPVIVQKDDGAFLYATTDLATLQYRINEWHAKRIVYITDGRQQLHFQQIFAIARRWGITLPLEHVWFGAVLGPDKKPIKTREGKPIKLRDLLDEAVQRAGDLIETKRPGLSPETKAEIARKVGIGGLKYSDLCQNRNLDYLFSWDRMLALDGNTAPYLQYAYVRIRSIFRKAGAEADLTATVTLEAPEELALAKKLLSLHESIEMAASEFRPHYLCVYLFELATGFSKFFEACPVLKSEGPTRASRLVLCHLTASTLHLGLDLLGIETMEEM